MALTRAQRFQASLIALVGYPLIAVLSLTWRWRVEGAHHWDEVVRSGHQPILALWHGRILAGLHYFRHRGIVVMTSQNFDGEWIARILHRFGFGTARGSSSRGGARALVRLRREMAAGRPAAFTVDGPRGPARVIQPGVVWLAALTGNPILPYHVESAPAWTASSWDAAQIPKPFSTVALVIGEPIRARSTAPGAIEETRAELAASLDSLESAARAVLSAHGTAR